MTDPRYIYDCEVLRVVDGDTVDLRIDLGLSISSVQRVRLYGINAPEKRGKTRDAGNAATDHLKQLIASNRSIQVETFQDKQGKYGRYLATLIGSESGDLNQQMIDDSHAVEYMK